MRYIPTQGFNCILIGTSSNLWVRPTGTGSERPNAPSHGLTYLVLFLQDHRWYPRLESSWPKPTHHPHQQTDKKLRGAALILPAQRTACSLKPFWQESISQEDGRIDMRSMYRKHRNGSCNTIWPWEIYNSHLGHNILPNISASECSSFTSMYSHFVGNRVVSRE